MTSNPRVLFLAPPGRQRSQLSRYSILDEEIRALAARGVDAFVLSSLDGGSFDDGHVHVRALPPHTLRERAATVRFLTRHVPRLSARGLLRLERFYTTARAEMAAVRLIERERIELIHSYFAWPGGFGGLLAKAETGLPLVAGLRGSDVNTLPAVGYGARLRPLFAANLHRLLQSADATISVSEFVRRQGIALGAPAERARVILKGVRLDLFDVPTDRGAARAALGLPSVPIILAVGGYVAIKAVDQVIEALAQVRSSGREFTFIVCGEGPQRKTLEAQIARLGLGGVVKLTGRISRGDIATYFAAADMFVHGALIEASGNVLLEAMASGLPIVCTDAGGPAEYVSDGVTGFVVPVAQPSAIADRICRLLDDSQLRLSFGSAGRRRAQELFSYDRMIDEMLSVYRSLLQRTSTATTDGPRSNPVAGGRA